jgi:glyoxylase-like metal-dependent hydrolase (beta-lactamase superfamily II)
LDKLKAAVARAGVTLEKILLTHGHADHCGQAGMLAKELSLPIEGRTRPTGSGSPGSRTTGRGSGSRRRFSSPTAGWWTATPSVRRGRARGAPLPGPHPGHVVFFHRASQFAFVGDVLFEGSIGRTDFPMGNHQDLLDAITGKLWPLGDEVTFVPRPRAPEHVRARAGEQSVRQRRGDRGRPLA